MCRVYIEKVEYLTYIDLWLILSASSTLVGFSPETESVFFSLFESRKQLAEYISLGDFTDFTFFIQDGRTRLRDGLLGLMVKKIDLIIEINAEYGRNDF